MCFKSTLWLTNPLSHWPLWLCLLGVVGFAKAESNPETLKPVLAVSSPAIIVAPEVVVTAQKRAQQLEDVPISITVINSQALENTHARTLSEMQQLVPNFSIASPAGDPTITLRGVGGGGRNIGFDTRVGVYLDGVYLGQSQALNLSLLDIERIEVLRGPQGYLFGRNTDAGAVSLISKPPSEKFEGYYTTGFASYGTFENALSVSGAVSQAAQAKLAVRYDSRDGFGENIFNHDDVDGFKRLSSRAQLSMQPSESLSLDLYADYTDIKQNNIYAETTSAMFGVPLSGGALPDYTINIDLQPKVINRYAGLNLNGNYEFASGHQLTSITAYRTTHQQRIVDDDLTSANLFNVNFKDDFYQSSQELRFASPLTQPVRYLAGVYWLNEQAKSDRSASIGADTNTLVNFPAVPVPVPFGALFGVQAGAIIPVLAEVDTRSYALFGAVDYDVLEHITLSVGGRYTYEKKHLLFNSDGSQSGSFGIATLNNEQDVFSEDDFSPSLGISYALDKNNNIYAKYASGFKSGGWNVDFLTPTQVARGLRFQKETVDSVELGFKGQSENHRTHYDVALFISDYADYQVFQLVKVGAQNELQLRNAAKVQSKGLEASITSFVTDHLQLGANIGLLNARFQSFPDGLAAGVDASGKRLPDAPEFSANISVNYSIPAPELEGEFCIYVEDSYRSASYSAVSINSDAFAVDSRSIVNARLSYVSKLHRLQASIYANNALDESYLSALAIEFLGAGVIKRGDPRVVGLQARYDF